MATEDIVINFILGLRNYVFPIEDCCESMDLPEIVRDLIHYPSHVESQLDSVRCMSWSETVDLLRGLIPLIRDTGILKQLSMIIKLVQAEDA